SSPICCSLPRTVHAPGHPHAAYPPSAQCSGLFPTRWTPLGPTVSAPRSPGPRTPYAPAPTPPPRFSSSSRGSSVPATAPRSADPSAPPVQCPSAGCSPPPPNAAIVLAAPLRDRKSTRLNSSHVKISYAVFCLKKKKKLYQT